MCVPRSIINFLAGIIKRGCPTAPYLSDMRRETSRALGRSEDDGKLWQWHL